MNDTMSILLATTVLALGGLGLYIWDTRKDTVVNTYNQYRTVGGSRRHKKRIHKRSHKSRTYKKDR